MRATLPAIVLIVVGLAGCAEDDVADADAAAPPAADEGAIAGLLVDDRFRPIELTDGPGNSEFQVDGFVLLEELGVQTRTNENGEFAFRDLAPGTYTLRVQADGHEATPQTLAVEGGEFTETSVVARRVISNEGAVIVQQYAFAMQCTVQTYTLYFFLSGGSCYGDFGGDSPSNFFTFDVADFPGAGWIVMEALMQNDGSYDGFVTGDGAAELNSWRCRDQVYGSDYLRFDCAIGEVTEGNFAAIEPGVTQRVQFYELHTGSEELGGGFGATVIEAGTVAMSVFIGPPPADVADYCVLCTV